MQDNNNIEGSACEDEVVVSDRKRKPPLSATERKRHERARKKTKFCWTELEEKLFEDAVKTLNGWGDWISVARIIPTRTKSKHKNSSMLIK